ncbi:MAG: EthD domain-containing protein, partial [Myxococcota bacterium]
MFAFIRRRADITRDAFRSHYEEIHVPTALPCLGGILRYERQHIREEIFGAPGFDCMSRFDYRDGAAVRAALERIEGPQGDAIRRDELLFMDKPANFFFAVEEAPTWEATPARAGRARLLVCVRRPQAEALAGFRARFLAEGLPTLRAAVEDI